MKTKHFLFFALSFLLILLINTPGAMAQCSICSKVVADQGENVAKGFNAGILYLAAVPFTVIGIIGYKWYKGNILQEEEPENND